jgi:hypothetical protein
MKQPATSRITDSDNPGWLRRLVRCHNLKTRWWWSQWNSYSSESYGIVDLQLRYLLISLRYRLRVVLLHLKYLPVKFYILSHGVRVLLNQRNLRRLKRECERLNALDDGSNLAVTNLISQLNAKVNDVFNFSHKSKRAAMTPNEKS